MPPLTLPRSSSPPPFSLQGDMSLYSSENLRLRNEIRFHPDIRDAILRW